VACEGIVKARRGANEAARGPNPADRADFFASGGRRQLAPKVSQPRNFSAAPALQNPALTARFARSFEESR